MTVLWSAGLAALAVACLVGLPRPAPVRVAALLRQGPPSAVPSAAETAARPAAGRRPGARRWTVAAAATVALASAVVGVQAVVPLLLLTGAAAATVRLRRSRAAASAGREERSRAVEACSALAGELRAGRAPADAFAAAADLATGASADVLRAAAGAVRLGGDPAASLRVSSGSAVPEVLRALGACWTVCAGSGAGLANAVERLEEGLRADAAQRRAVDAELAGPRATAGLLAVLPAGGLLLAAGLGADPLQVLLTTPIGLLCLTVGLALDALGLWWTGRLVASAGGRS